MHILTNVCMYVCITLTHTYIYISSVQFSWTVVSNFLWPHELQHSRPPCPSPTPGVRGNPYPLSRWCHPTILSFVTPFSSSPTLLRIRIFSNELALPIRWLKYWSFSFGISPSKKYSRMTSFRIDWFDLFAVQGTLKSLLQRHI